MNSFRQRLLKFVIPHQRERERERERERDLNSGVGFNCGVSQNFNFENK